MAEDGKRKSNAMQTRMPSKIHSEKNTDPGTSATEPTHHWSLICAICAKLRCGPRSTGLKGLVWSTVQMVEKDAILSPSYGNEVPSHLIH